MTPDPDQSADRTPAQELGALLRSRRERLAPVDVGLREGGRRRAPGLRREEVASLAAISPTYLAFLEQGREVHPSRAVVEALAGALRLTPAERAYAVDLARAGAGEAGPGTGDGAAREELAAGVAAFVDRLDPHPAYVTGRTWDVLASNRGARLLWTDWTARPAGERNLLRWMLGDAAARERYADWEGETRAQLARFRAAVAPRQHEAPFAEAIARVLSESAEAAAWWERQEVAPLTSGRKRLRHPALGELVLDHVVLQAGAAPDQKLLAFTLAPEDVPRVAALLDSACMPERDDR